MGITVGRKARLLRRRVVAGVDHTRADLAGARLDGLDLRGKVFREARLRGADLSGCNLIGVNLEGADLSDAWLTDAQLNGANLRAANLTRAYACGVDFDGAQIDDMIFDGLVRDHSTIWPTTAGMSSSPNGERDMPPASASTTEPSCERRGRRLASGIPVGLVGRVVEGRRAGFFVEVDDDAPRPGGSVGWYVRYWNGDTADHDWFRDGQDVPAAFTGMRVEWLSEKESTRIPGRHCHDFR